jgi:hypothetical protein
LAACLGRWRAFRAFPQHGPPRRVQLPKSSPTQANRRFFRLDSKLFSKVQIDSKRGLGSKVFSTPPPLTTEFQNFAFRSAAKSSEFPSSVATFIVNSEPHAHRGTSLGPVLGVANKRQEALDPGYA